MRDSRMGIEVEIHGIWFTLRQSKTGEMWPTTPGVDVETTLIGHDAILAPMNMRTKDVDWESAWGFIVCGDDFTKQQVGNSPTYFGKCCFEINTSARPIKDIQHWVTSQQAIRIFRECIASFVEGAKPSAKHTKHSKRLTDDEPKWYPIDNLIAEFNHRVDKALKMSGGPVDSSGWKLAKSPALQELETTGKWQGYFHVPVTEMVPLWCDAQVNYEMDLADLYDRTDDWIDVWKSVSIEKAMRGYVDIDSPSGHVKGTSTTAIYRNQIGVALWKAAKAEADRFVQLRDANAAALGQDSRAKALLMMVFANAVITPHFEAGTCKNSYSQFPKSSPAALALAIELEQGTLRAPMRRIPALVRDGKNAVLRMRRDLAQFLPTVGPGHEVMPAYTAYQDQILTEALHTDFDQMWSATFRNAPLLARTNRFGYTTEAPFYCYWAHAHTSRQPIRDQGRIRTLFESRFGHNRLNLGFNPDTSVEQFYIAYESLLGLLAQSDTERHMAGRSLRTVSGVGGSKLAELRRAIAAGQRVGVH